MEQKASRRGCFLVRKTIVAKHVYLKSHTENLLAPSERVAIPSVTWKNSVVPKYAAELPSWPFHPQTGGVFPPILCAGPPNSSSFAHDVAEAKERENRTILLLYGQLLFICAKGHTMLSGDSERMLFLCTSYTP